jgi:hypothetical protein
LPQPLSPAKLLASNLRPRRWHHHRTAAAQRSRSAVGR